jgi:uncharacterized glyoxalase superfamily protein PhnB
MPAILKHHYVLAVHDAEASARFFCEVLGFARHPVGDDGWRFVERDGFMIMLGSCPGTPPAREIGDHSYFAYFSVDDVDGYFANMQNRGVDFLSHPADKPWGMREFGLRTPDGHRIMIGQELK